MNDHLFKYNFKLWLISWRKITETKASFKFSETFTELFDKNSSLVLSLRLTTKTRHMKALLTMGILLLFIRCGTQKNAIQEQEQPTDSSTMIKATIGEFKATTDPVTISNIRVSGNTLLIDVSYSGGCEKHAFEVIGSPMIAKSLPPIRHIQLVHNANGDKCKKLELKTIEVDIKELAYQQESGSEIYLTIDGWEERILYTFE